MDREDLEELLQIKKIVKRPRLQSLIIKEIEKIEQPDTPAEEVQRSRYITEYDHIGWLGKGGFGCVLRGQHKLDKQHYAIKFIKINGKDAACSPNKAVREAKLMSRLYHVNVVRYHQVWYDSFKHNLSWFGGTNKEIDSEDDSGEDDEPSGHDFVCFQMQLCERTLHDVLEPSVYQYNREKAINIFRQIVEGVGYMHEKGIAHNDLNPKNIFFVADTVKIGDFGLATFLSGGGSDKEPDSSGSSTGVPSYYLAPEGRPANEKVDIYSLGVILFELYHPFGTGVERGKKLEALKGGTLDSNVAVKSPKASSLVKQLMAMDPTDRPSAKDLLELHIDTLLED